MDCSMLGFPVLHQHPEVAQTHIHSVSDAIQSSHRLSSPFPPPFNFPNIRVISNEPVLHIRWGNYWSFNISLSQYQGLFPMSQFFTSGGHSIGTSASALVLPMNIQDWFSLGWTRWFLQSKGLLRVLSNTTVQNHQFFSVKFLYSPNLTSIHDYWKNHSFD